MSKVRVVTVELFGGPDDGTRLDVPEEPPAAEIVMHDPALGEKHWYGRISRTRYEYLRKV